MKQVNITIPVETYSLTNDEINVLHAMAYYMLEAVDDLTPKAKKIVSEFEEKFRMHDAIGCCKVWKD